MDIFKLILAGLIPVAFAVGFFLLEQKTAFGKLSKLKRQIIIGFAYGVLACLATQFGIRLDGYVMNVRSASPLIAGLAFGGPAGIIAGVMGAVYRLLVVLWMDNAQYTQIACSVATLLAGLISTLCYRFMSNNKRVNWFYGVFIAIATEVFHMLLVFVTHMDDIQKAFTIVQATAIIMICANATAVFLALFIISLLAKDRYYTKRNKRPLIQTFSICLFGAVLVAFIATSSFTYVLEDNVSKSDVKSLLELNIDDIKNDIKNTTDNDLLDITEKIKNDIDSHPETFHSNMTDAEKQSCRENFEEKYNVSEINIVDSNGVIFLSTFEANEGDSFYDSDNENVKAFTALLSGEASIVQDYRSSNGADSSFTKFAGKTLDVGGFVQVGYDFEHCQESIENIISQVAKNRHVGQNGFLFILSPGDGSIVSEPVGAVDETVIAEFMEDIASLDNGVVEKYSLDNGEGESYYYMKDEVEGYIVIGCIPVTEATFARNTSVYIGAFMQLIVFFTLFMLVFFMLKKLIVNNLHKVNNSLSRITDGDLNIVVDVSGNEEFVSLSNDINSTVSKLKGFIEDAEKRIDMELAFAKTIQLSVLPSVFPPYPNRHEFDIYAMMDTAKEVGGDFYDFYILNREQLVFAIADVSGKGIPAAMFMMNAKSIIKSLTESGLSASEAFTEANNKLCANNEAGMFVTAWMGILDLETGVVKYVNAGHNPPVVKHKDGSYDYLRTRHGLVLAGMENIKYRENEITLEEGDEIFLYTDGITEAINTDTEQFGETRLLKALNDPQNESATELCKHVKKELVEFVNGAAQFDDITMLSLKYLKKYEEK